MLHPPGAQADLTGYAVDLTAPVLLDTPPPSPSRPVPSCSSAGHLEIHPKGDRRACSRPAPPGFSGAGCNCRRGHFHIPWRSNRWPTTWYTLLLSPPPSPNGETSFPPRWPLWRHGATVCITTQCVMRRLGLSVGFLPGATLTLFLCYAPCSSRRIS